jgi:hypothetical protein
MLVKNIAPFGASLAKRNLCLSVFTVLKVINCPERTDFHNHTVSWSLSTAEAQRYLRKQCTRRNRRDALRRTCVRLK